MPIDTDQFEDAKELHDPPTSKRIIQFLIVHADQEYTRQVLPPLTFDPFLGSWQNLHVQHNSLLW